MIKIISDGTGRGTEVYSQDGSPIDGVTSIVLRVKSDGMVHARLDFIGVELEMLATWDRHPLKLWADRKVMR